MGRIVIADSSCLIALGRIGRLELLTQCFPRVATTSAVISEVGSTPAWLEELPLQDYSVEAALRSHLHAGEASIIALGFEQKNSVLILDDRAARHTAERLGLRYMGTLGVLIHAKRCGYIDAVKPLIDDFGAEGFRIAPALRTHVLELADEHD